MYITKSKHMFPSETLKWNLNDYNNNININLIDNDYKNMMTKKYDITNVSGRKKQNIYFNMQELKTVELIFELVQVQFFFVMKILKYPKT